MSFRHKSTGYFRTSVIMVLDHDPSCIQRARLVYSMEFPSHKLLLVVIVYVLSGDTGESKEGFSRYYSSEQLF